MYKIEKLAERHYHILKSFVSKEKDLQDFLLNDAIDNMNKNISATYIFIDSEQINAYLTILTDSIKLNSNLKNKFIKKNIGYKSLPAIKIGRLCVHDKFQKRGLGSDALAFIYRLLCKVNNEIGCRFITLDAKKESMRFYLNHGFEILRNREYETIPMYKDMDKIINENKSNQNI